MSKLGNVLIFIGLILLILGFVSFRALANGMMPFVWVLLGLGLACILVAIFKDIKFFIELAGQRTTKHGLNLGVLVLIVVAIIFGVNFIGYKHVKKIDYTKEGLHSLSDQTKKVLKSLDSDMQVRAFFVDNSGEGAAEKGRFKDVADLYAVESPHVKISFTNPVKNPALAKQYDITASGTVSIEYKGRKAKFEDLTEQGFTNAIIKITRDKNKIIYFTTGHGEHDIESTDPTELQQFKKYLSDSSYDVKPLSFAQTQKVPDDAAVVIVAGPKQAFFQPEIEALKDYLYKGGKMLVALDPGTKSNLGQLTDQLGVEFKNNYIMDQLGMLVGGGIATATGIQYSSSSEITKGFRNAMTVFQLASQLKVAKNKPETIQVDEIVKSSPASIASPVLQERGELKMVEGRDEKGPVDIAAQATGKLKEEPGKGAPQEFSAVVVGDSDFLTNQLIDAQLNHDFALNTVSFLAKDKELVSIRPKQSEGNMITMTPVQSTLLYYGIVWIVPILMLFTGGTFWYRRRTV
jgi:ABC-type uncharacterized transport system involved in gliding motility auxiliary subunit